MNDGLREKLKLADLGRATGRVRGVSGLSISGTLPGARVGETVSIGSSGLHAVVVGFSEDTFIAMPLGWPTGVGPDDTVRFVASRLEVSVSDALLGRVVDSLGRPLDGGELIEGTARPIDNVPPPALLRSGKIQVLTTGVRVIDGLLTLGEGQRVGLFSGSGVGKSTLLRMLAKGTSAEVVVIGLVGERGREARETAEAGMAPNTVCVVSTSDEAPMVRLVAALTATTIAEHFRDQGKRVLLLLDSLTRVARAQRDIGLAAGETPARRGYPPSVLTLLPRLIERAGNGARGSITGIYTVLVEGDDLDEPVADEARGVLDGHIVLSRNMAERGVFPAVDVVQSVSRVMAEVVSKEHFDVSSRVRSLVAGYESKRDLIELGAYTAGSDARVDRAIARLPAYEAFVSQSMTETNRESFDTTVARLSKLA